MKLHELNIDDIIKSIENEKPQKGTAFIEKQLLAYAPQLIDLLDKGYSEEQIYNNFPTKALDEIEMDKKVFIRKLKTAINKYKKAIEKTPIPAPALKPADKDGIDDETNLV